MRASITLDWEVVVRFTEAEFAQFTGTTPIPVTLGKGSQCVTATTAAATAPERRPAPHGDDPAPLRTRARALHDNAHLRGHTCRDAMRILKRHLSNALFRTMLRDTHSHHESFKRAVYGFRILHDYRPACSCNTASPGRLATRHHSEPRSPRLAA